MPQLLKWLATLGIAVAGFYVGVKWAKPLSQHPAASPDAGENAEQVASSESLVAPSPQWTPDQVVTLQVESLRATRHDPRELQQCFALASPANRLATGPIERFSLMVRQFPYYALVDQQSSLVGHPVFRGTHAVVLVTAADAKGRITAFQFLLSKQTSSPYVGCWMTDAVWQVEGAVQPRAATGASPSRPI